MKKIIFLATVLLASYVTPKACWSQLMIKTCSMDRLDFVKKESPLRSLEKDTANIPARRTVSPVDTMHMSILERMMWGRHGFMRFTGLYSLDSAKPVNDFRQMAKVRRKMLTLHQALGLATVASMTVTVIGGLQDYNKTGRSGNSLHRTSIPFTIGLYSATAVLALSSPPKLIPSEKKWDTIRFHKIFAAVHLAGMILTPMLSPSGFHHNMSQPSNYNQQKKIHAIAGLVTYAAFTSGMLVVILFR